MKEQMHKNFPINALGCMCGTSLDGLDLAMIRTDGNKIFSFGSSKFTEFNNEERKKLKLALGKWPGEEYTAEATEIIEKIHIKEIANFDTDLVGFHGQTLAHDPENMRTHQVGSGKILAEALKLPIVWDFRTLDLVNGGQGAPLAPFFHFACAKFINATKIIAFLNLGGVGNITIVNPACDRPDEEGALLAFDTGPANAPIDDIMYEKFKQNYDADGRVAAEGKVDQHIILRFLSNNYFRQPAPKSLDRNSFSNFIEELNSLLPKDAIATATAACIESVKISLNSLSIKPELLLVSGGGRKNKVLMEGLRKNLPMKVSSIDDYGLDGDMLEAQAFGYLAVRVFRGFNTSSPSTTGVTRGLSGGKISFPA